MNISGLKILCLAALFAIITPISSAQAQYGYSSPYSWGPQYPSAQYSGPADPFGEITKCESVWNKSDKSINGGKAGFTPPSQDVCFSGGGSSFCVDMSSYQSDYLCAGADIIEGTGLDYLWTSFDPGESDELNETQTVDFYSRTTRDAARGRAGHDMALYMNAFDVCRQIDNSAKSLPPVFMGALTEEEWRTVHGVPAGGNPNRASEGGAGYDVYANDASISVGFQTCCAPVVVNVCGVPLNTGYGVVGDIATMHVRDGGIFASAQIQCVGNNDWRMRGIEGICSGSTGGGGGGGGGGATGYSNPETGGEISAEDAAAGGVPDGYNADASVENTNAQGAADQREAREAAAQEAKEAAEAAAKAAAEAAEQAAKDAESDDDDDD
jgi:hypothetical protein